MFRLMKINFIQNVFIIKKKRMKIHHTVKGEYVLDNNIIIRKLILKRSIDKKADQSLVNSHNKVPTPLYFSIFLF